MPSMDTRMMLGFHQWPLLPEQFNPLAYECGRHTEFCRSGTPYLTLLA